LPLSPAELLEHHTTVAEAILLGRVVPFLGAGVNLVDRRPDERFQLGVNLPSGAELASLLADAFRYPGVEACPLAPQPTAIAVGDGGAAAAPAPAHCLRPHAQIDLARVAQFGDSMRGDAALYEAMSPVFHCSVPPTSAHQFLACLPSPARGAEEARHPLIVSTNYDDLLERQYQNGAGASDYDFVFYWPKPGEQSRFYHVAPRAAPVAITDAANYPHPFFETCPTVLKIHGTIRPDAADDAFVITENDYVTYLADNTLESLLPRRLLKKLQTNHLLFMGYSLQDWNLRVFLQRLKRSQRSYRAWAIVRDDNPADRVFWERHGIQIIPVPLSDYLVGLNSVLQRIARGA